MALDGISPLESHPRKCMAYYYRTRLKRILDPVRPSPAALPYQISLDMNKTRQLGLRPTIKICPSRTRVVIYCCRLSFGAIYLTHALRSSSATPLKSAAACPAAAGPDCLSVSQDSGWLNRTNNTLRAFYGVYPPDTRLTTLISFAVFEVYCVRLVHYRAHWSTLYR